MTSPSNRRRILHLVYREGFGPVFTSQVLHPASWLARHGEDIRVGVFSTWGEMLRPSLRSQWAALVAGAGVSVSRLPCWRRATPPPWDEAVLSAWVRLAGRGAPTILHCRNERMADLALRLRRRDDSLRVVFDYRGITHAEHAYEKGVPADDPDVRRLYDRERRVAREADAVLCVSHALARYTADEYGVPGERVRVVPCCVAAEEFGPARAARDATRRELGLSGRFVVAYSGSVQKWQQPEACARLFLEIRRLTAEAHFLVLASQPGRMREILRRSGVADAESIVLRVPPADVPRYLAAGDVGLLLREESLVNRVASPVKFGEYLASGTPVILTPGIGDDSALVEAEKLGLLLPPGETGRLAAFLDDYRRNTPAWRNRCADFATRRLSWDAHLPSLRALYDQLAPAAPR